MSIKSPRNKGAAGERELARILGDRLGVSLTRNLDQWRAGGGYDLLGLAGIALEVKRCERLTVSQWWRQAKRQAGNLTPVLAYRQSRQPWTFILPASALNPDLEGVAALDLDGFVSYCRLITP